MRFNLLDPLALRLRLRLRSLLFLLVLLAAFNAACDAQAAPESRKTAASTETNATASDAQLEVANLAFFSGDFAKSKSLLEQQPSKDTRTLINLGLCELGLNAPDKAQIWFDQARKIIDKSNNTDALEIGDCWMGLGQCHYMQGQMKEAMRDFSEALSFYQQKFGRWHPETVAALEGLAGTVSAEGDHQHALNLFRQIAQIDLKHFGPEHRRLGLSLYNLSEAYYKLNDCQNSRATFEQALLIFRKACAKELESQFLASSDMRSAAQNAAIKKRIQSTVLGMMPPQGISNTSFKLLADDGFDSNKVSFKLRPNDFNNWRVQRRIADDIFYVGIDPTVEQKGLIVCVHGLGLHAGSFGDFARKINPFGYGVIAIDVRGFGSLKTEKGLDKLDLDDALEDLNAAISLFRSQNPDMPVFILGESMGGALALQLTARYPEAVDALISSVPSGKRFKSKSTGLLIGIKLIEDKNKPIEIGKKVIEQATEDQSVRKSLLADPDSRLKLSPEELLHFQEFMNNNSKLAREIKDTPVLVFQGYKDHLVKPEGTFSLYDLLATPQKNLVLVGEAEHLIFEEGQAPPDIVAMLAAWLDAHRKVKVCPAPSQAASK